MRGSGYRVPPALARRADGQVVQLTPLLYARPGGGRRPAYVRPDRRCRQRRDRHAASRRTTCARWSRRKLRHTGLAGQCGRYAARDEEVAAPARPPVPVRRHRPGADPPPDPPVHPAVQPPAGGAGPGGAFAAVSWWLLFVKGLASATHEAFNRPDLFLLVVVVTALSAGFHEFGHAAAARRGGATPGAMGAGHLSRVAGVLHRRHRHLPPRPGRSAAHRPRRPLLQRDRRARDRSASGGRPATTRCCSSSPRRSCR